MNQCFLPVPVFTPPPSNDGRVARWSDDGHVPRFEYQSQQAGVCADKSRLLLLCFFRWVREGMGLEDTRILRDCDWETVEMFSGVFWCFFCPAVFRAFGGRFWAGDLCALTHQSSFSSVPHCGVQRLSSRKRRISEIVVLDG